MVHLGYLQGPVFPPEKLVSPVAEALRQVLSRFSWALQGGALLPPPASPTMPDEDEGDTSFGPTLTSTPFSTPDRSMHQRPTAVEGGAPHVVGGDFTDAANSVGEHLQGDYRCEWGVHQCETAANWTLDKCVHTVRMYVCLCMHACALLFRVRPSHACFNVVQTPQAVQSL